MTGESEPVRKENGMYVYAGTAVEEGNLIVRVKKAAGSTRFERIVKMIEESEKLKSSLETKASGLADALVPWSLGGTIVTYLLTRNVTKAISILMVRFLLRVKARNATFCSLGNERSEQLQDDRQGRLLHGSCR